MAKLTKAQREWRPGMPKKRRSIKVMFASTVLTLEAFVVLFGTLAVFGVHRDTVSPPLLLGGGLLLAAAMIGTCAVLSKPAGPAIGWILQLVLIATGFLDAMMFLVGGLFALTWWYGLRAGQRLDRENRERDRMQAEWEKAHPEEGDAAAAPEPPVGTD
ncbi:MULTISPECIES: DUF4233 domain-containing protein [unclassified Arthrobacter]|uniref:DUF4233 domain-containing protein n=1 Tax=unclassified Arthrobacter TaxID=235627 RepID=UPI001E4D9947|nr:MULTISPECIES: DUF4233 domain-containing protein [unclassified Arthrobacter]MCC9145646.1 DUF4233 domain-containing protein [Arthrobacter sp. zg-Y919]MDK1276875.1 DUF4233 domain-containing protein [Arthrobacter sp. zg.Y919]MDM7989513.1 DUF4233 domain-containing protein [Arthrobacter sp. zg-Y877]WIB04191.1 DUF4233 domain-containing protein [Arthrobacter sp. zg-Y919]